VGGEEGEAPEGGGVRVGEGEEARVGGGGGRSEERVHAGHVGEGDVVLDYDDWGEAGRQYQYERGRRVDVLVPTGIAGLRDPDAFVTGVRR